MQLFYLVYASGSKFLGDHPESAISFHQHFLFSNGQFPVPVMMYVRFLIIVLTGKGLHDKIISVQIVSKRRVGSKSPYT